jgi:hypothetical protein
MSNGRGEERVTHVAHVVEIAVPDDGHLRIYSARDQRPSSGCTYIEPGDVEVLDKLPEVRALPLVSATEV